MWSSSEDTWVARNRRTTKRRICLLLAMALLGASAQMRFGGNVPTKLGAFSLPTSCRGEAYWKKNRRGDHVKGGYVPYLAIARGAADEVATTTASSTVVGSVTEVDRDTFWPLVEQAGDKVVVLDMYTQWCGPCKLILPKIIDLSTKYTDVVFCKLDCNQHNKSLAKELGVRVVPTFKIFRGKQVVAEVAGAKFDELVKSIDKVRGAAQL